MILENKNRNWSLLLRSVRANCSSPFHSCARWNSVPVSKLHWHWHWHWWIPITGPSSSIHDIYDICHAACAEPTDVHQSCHLFVTHKKKCVTHVCIGLLGLILCCRSLLISDAVSIPAAEHIVMCTISCRHHHYHHHHQYAHQFSSRSWPPKNSDAAAN